MLLDPYEAERPSTHPFWPREMIDRHRAGEVSRNDLMEYLATFPYVPRQPSEDPGYEVPHPGEFGNVSFALNRDEYAELYDRIHQRKQL